MRVLSTDGLVFVDNLNAADAGDVGRHWNAVRRYLDHGDVNALYQMQGRMVAGFELETRTEVIEWLAIRGDVRFESIYDEVV